MPSAMKQSVADIRHEYVRSAVGGQIWHDARSRLTEGERAVLREGDASGSCPTALAGRFMSDVVGLVCPNREDAERFLREGGAAQADAMLDGVFSVFSRFVSPAQALKRAPSVLASVYKGTSADSVLSASGRGGSLTIRGLGDYEYVSPWVCGWMERAIERFGGSAAAVRERSWDAGAVSSDELVFEASWE